MRNLASVKKIISIKPIPGADKIECAQVLGFECVIGKNEFKINDLIVYFEVDSILPEKPEFEFLRPRKFRIKIIKLKNQFSEGICFPLSILPKGKYKEDDDVTDIIGVIKYDPEATREKGQSEPSKPKNPIIKFLMKFKWYRRYFSSKPEKGWPEFIPHTDEERIQKVPYICTNYKNTLFVATEKLDGTSATYALKRLKRKWYHIKDHFKFYVCSRHINIKTPNNSYYWKIAKQLNMKENLLELIGDKEFVVLQGEIIGEGIQKNKYKLKGIDFKAFNLIYPEGRLNQIKMWIYLTGCMNYITCVPLISSEFILGDSIQECVELSKGKSKLADIHREGLVIRNEDLKISFKIKNPEFTLQYQDEDE
jgi:hypothetical protein